MGVHAQAIAAGIGAFGNLAGGLLGRRKGKSPGDAIRSSVKAARQLGLHPLSVLGSGATYAPVGSMGNSSFLADAADNIGQGFREAVENRERRRADAAEAQSASAFQAKQTELIDAQIEEARSRTFLNAANAKRLLGPVMPRVSGDRGGLEKLGASGTLDGRPIRMEPASNMPARQKVQLGNVGATSLNPDAFEVGVSELAAGLMIMGPQWLWNWANTPVERTGGRRAPGENNEVPTP